MPHKPIGYCFVRRCSVHYKELEHEKVCKLSQAVFWADFAINLCPNRIVFDLRTYHNNHDVFHYIQIQNLLASFLSVGYKKHQDQYVIIQVTTNQQYSQSLNFEQLDRYISTWNGVGDDDGGLYPAYLRQGNFYAVECCQYGRLELLIILLDLLLYIFWLLVNSILISIVLTRQ